MHALCPRYLTPPSPDVADFGVDDQCSTLQVGLTILPLDPARRAIHTGMGPDRGHGLQIIPET